MPLGFAQGCQLLVVSLYIFLAIILNGRQLAVVLQLMFQLRELGDDPFPFFGEGFVIGGPSSAMDVVNALCKDDRPAGESRSMCE